MFLAVAHEKPPADVAAVKLWLRNLRKARGLTQEELATIAGVSTRTIINLENPKMGLATGLPFIKVLRELGVLHGAPIQDQPTLTDRLDAIESLIVRTSERSEDVAEKRIQELQQLIETLDLQNQRREPPKPDEQNQQNG